MTFSRGDFPELDSGIAWSVKSLVHTFGLTWLTKLWRGCNVPLNQCRFEPEHRAWRVDRDDNGKRQ